MANEEPATMATAAQVIVPHLLGKTVHHDDRMTRIKYRHMAHFCDRAACACLFIECLQRTSEQSPQLTQNF